MKNKIILYTQQGCPQCKMVHMMLDRKGIVYDERQDLDEMRVLGISHTPALFVDNMILVGKQLMLWIQNH